MTVQLTVDQLSQILPKNKEVAAWHKSLVKILPKYKINTVERVAAFLAQCAHESSDFTVVEENLKYSAKRLQEVWPRRFNAATAARVQYSPEKIAEIAYSGRMGNNQPGDGYRFRGQGIIQLTGRDNYTNFGKAFNFSAERAAEHIKSKDGAVEAAAWFWNANNLNKWVDAGDFDGLSDAINIGRKTAAVGDAHGYADRKRRYNLAVSILSGKAARPQPVVKPAPAPVTKPAAQLITGSEEITTKPKRRRGPAIVPD